jgi:hypothetical protein
MLFTPSASFGAVALDGAQQPPGAIQHDDEVIFEFQHRARVVRASQRPEISGLGGYAATDSAYKSVSLLLLTVIILPASAELAAPEAVPQLSRTGCQIR